MRAIELKMKKSDQKVGNKIFFQILKNYEIILYKSLKILKSFTNN